LRFGDHNGRERKLKGFSDKAATVSLGRRIEKLIDLRKSGTRPDAETLKWLEEISKDLRERLLDIGLIDGETANRSRPLVCSKCDSTGINTQTKEACYCNGEHLTGYLAFMRGKESVERHVLQTLQRIRRIFRECGFTHYSDIDGSVVESFLAGMRSEKFGGSAQTRNHHLAAIRGFCNWMHKKRRASENPVIHLEMLNVSEDRRHDRRPFTPEEVFRLIQATVAGPVRWRISGLDRGMLYRTGFETGFRRGELAELTIGDFDLDAETPFVRLSAKHTKNSDEANIPLRQEFISELRKWFDTLGNEPKRKLWPILPKSTAKILRYDLAEANIEYQDEAGRFRDFHSLRHAYVTALAHGASAPKTVQSLARHRNIGTTLQVYAHSRLKEEAVAIEALPHIPSIFDGPGSNEMKATGTFDSVPVSVPDSASGHAMTRREKGSTVQSGSRRVLSLESHRNSRKTANHSVKKGVKPSPQCDTDKGLLAALQTGDSETESVSGKGLTARDTSSVSVSVPDSVQNLPSGVDIGAVWNQLPEELRRAILDAVQKP
jgi:integrase